MKEIELLKVIFKDSPDILELLNEINKKIDKVLYIIERIDYGSLGYEIVKEILQGSDKE